MVKNPEHNEVVRARLEAFLLALADTYPESREYVKEVWRRIEQSQPVPDGYVMVPVEPTEKWAGRLADGCEISVSHAKDTIETVLAAAPKPGAAHDRGEK